MGIDGKNLCVVCAWRQNCQKKFKLSPGTVRCPDFSRDLNLPESISDVVAPETGEKKGMGGNDDLK